jgi:hypothetical protein
MNSQHEAATLQLQTPSANPSFSSISTLATSEQIEQVEIASSVAHSQKTLTSERLLIILRFRA